MKETNDGEKDSSHGIVEGNTGLMTSFRSEAQGLVNLLWSGGITNMTDIFLDNLAVVYKVNEKHLLHPMQSEWELVEPARRKVQMEKLSVRHVKGHQDRTQGVLTREESLNVEADALTKEAHRDPLESGYLPPGYGILLYINGLRITTKIVEELQRAATTPELRLYYSKNMDGQTGKWIEWIGTFSIK